MAKVTGKFVGVERKVYIDDKELSPARSLEIINHSPDGFAWGYGGSGPSQLALALLLEFSDDWFAGSHYQAFKWDVIAGLDDTEFAIDSSIITDWIKAHNG